MEKKRPIGVTLIAYATFLPPLIILCVLFLPSSLIVRALDITRPEGIVTFRMATFSALVVFLALCFPIGNGLLKLRASARKSIVYYSTIMAIMMLYGLVSNQFMAYVLALFFSFFFISIIFYLTRPKIKEQFQK